MVQLENFIDRIEQFDQLSSSQKVNYFSYYLLYVKSQDCLTAKDVEECFKYLRLKPYSNISSLLSTKSKGKNHIYIKGKIGYVLERKAKENLEKDLRLTKKIILSEDYFPLQLVENTRGYIDRIAKQAISSYDYGLYDACLVMTRRLLETLIIELFEKNGLESFIKNDSGQFFFLSDLISKILAEKSWTIGRNAQQGLASIKKLGDLSAHNRRFLATKSDIDKIKMDVRIVIEELIHLIDFRKSK